MKQILVRWKYDVAIAGSYLTPFLTFVTLASFLYQTVGLQRWIPHYWQFLLISMATFFVLFKLVAKILLKAKFYAFEREYEAKINPLAVDKLTPKEHTYYIPYAIVHTELSIASLRMTLEAFDAVCNSTEYLKKRQEVLERLHELEKVLASYKELYGDKTPSSVTAISRAKSEVSK